MGSAPMLQDPRGRRRSSGTHAVRGRGDHQFVVGGPVTTHDGQRKARLASRNELEDTPLPGPTPSRPCGRGPSRSRIRCRAAPRGGERAEFVEVRGRCSGRRRPPVARPTLSSISNTPVTSATGAAPTVPRAAVPANRRRGRAECATQPGPGAAESPRWHPSPAESCSFSSLPAPRTVRGRRGSAGHPG